MAHCRGMLQSGVQVLQLPGADKAPSVHLARQPKVWAGQAMLHDTCLGGGAVGVRHLINEHNVVSLAAQKVMHNVPQTECHIAKSMHAV